MSEPSDLSARVTRLEASVQEIKERLAELGAVRSPVASRESVPEERVMIAAPVLKEPSDDLSVDIGLAGISVLILGGAYFLRALTESRVLPPSGAVIAGVLYAAVWMWKAHTAARANRNHAATFFAGTSAVIAFPLAWETTARFGILDPALAGAVVAAFGLVMVWLAHRDDIESLAWIGNFGVIGAAIAIAWTTRTLLPLMLAVAFVGAATLHASYRHGWSYLVWPGAVVADGLAFLTLAGSALQKNGYGPAIVAASLTLFAATWLAVIAARRLRHHEDPSIFDLVQSAEVAIMGLGGAVYVASIFEAGRLPLGLVLLAAAIAIYVFVLTSALEDTPLLRSAIDVVAAVLLLYATWLLLPTMETRAVAWTVIALAGAEAARRTGRTELLAQAVAFFVVAAIGSGLLLSTLGAFIEPKGDNLRLSPSAAVVAVFALLALLRTSGASRPARRILLAIVTCAAFTASMGELGPMAGSDRAMLALLRTVVLAVIAGALAFLGRTPLLPEGASIARAVVLVGGVKLLAEDVRVGRSSMLVAAFAAYGCAMLFVARRGKAVGVSEVSS